MFGKLLRKHNNKAFSLVELLCAICLLALIATPILQIVISSMTLNQKSSKLLAASDLASDAIEYISSLPFEDYETSIKGVRSHYYGKDAGLTLSDLDYYNSGTIKLYDNGPSGNISSSDFKNINASEFPGCVGRSLYITDVSYSGYKFDVRIVIKKKSSDSGKYFCYDSIVEIYEPRVDNGGGSYVYGNKIIDVSTCVPNTYK